MKLRKRYKKKKDLPELTNKSLFYMFNPLSLKENIVHKKRQATYITPLRPLTFASFPTWRIQQELVV